MSTPLRSAAIALIIFCFFSKAIFGQDITSIASNSPAFLVKGGRVHIQYGNSLVGKKIAIRDAYLIPFWNFEKNRCMFAEGCSDTFEATMLVAEVQSIWPEPVLLTAAHLRLKDFKKKPKAPSTFGETVLAEEVNNQLNPRNFVLHPGEIKVLLFQSGIRINGLLDFFTENIRSESIFCGAPPCFLHNQSRVSEFNKFLAMKIGRRAAVELTIYEKDYIPLLKTSFRLAEGSTLFDNGNVPRERYKLQHDKFIGEANYLLREGDTPFVSRVSFIRNISTIEK